tara:strand:+ start:33342 stop:34055 length:714 start_codon:yes stop_codon:yes gene_type:complete
MSNKEYILRKINSSEIINDPWRHIIIHDLMPQELYEGIKAETSAYLNSKHLRQAKKGFRAYHINVNRSQGVYPDRKLEPSLFEYYNLLSDNDIENAIKAKVNLEDYHADDLSKDMWSSFDIQSPSFVYDEVHSDHETKIHTLIHYLAEPEDDESLGTTLYRPDIAGLKQDVRSDFLARAKFIPNSALIFSPCSEKGRMTNHSMFHLSETTNLRKSLQTFWMKSKQNWTKPQTGRIEI